VLTNVEWVTYSKETFWVCVSKFLRDLVPASSW
jgi:hypothetical protein